jgi:hypothetical protein
MIGNLSINNSMRVSEITEQQKPQAPLSPAQARLRAMKQGVARQRLQVATEKESEQNAKHAEKITKLRAQALN